MHGLTDKQRQVLSLIAAQIGTTGQAPNRRELAAQFGVSSPCSIQRHVDALVKKGCLARGRYKYRALTLTDLGRVKVGEVVSCCPCCKRPYAESEVA